MNGKKFFKDSLVRLQIEHSCNPLSASAITAYILAHLECDDIGHIPANPFSLTKWVNRTGIPHSTIHHGWEVLFARGLMREEIIKGLPHYVIVGYMEAKTAEYPKGMNYFWVPTGLMESKALKPLVSSRDSLGLIMMLELFDTFTRKKDIKKGIVIEMKTLKEKMKKNSLKVRQWAQRVADLFSFEEINRTERRPRQGRVTTIKKNNPTQIVIESFRIHINPELIKDPIKIRKLNSSS